MLGTSMEIIAWDQNSRNAIHCVGVDFLLKEKGVYVKI